MVTQKAIMVVALLSIIPGEVSAHGSVINIFDAIDMALQSNIDIKQAANQKSVQYTLVGQSKSNFYPEIRGSVHSGWNYSRGATTTTAADSGSSGSVSFGIDSSINLFRGFYDVAALKESRIKLRASELDVTQAQQTIIFTTISQYIQVIVDKNLIEVDQENIEAQKQQLHVIEAFYTQGRRPVADLYYQKAELAKSELSLLNSMRDFEVSRLQLLKTLGLPSSSQIGLVPLDIDTLINRCNRAQIIAKQDLSVENRKDWEAQLHRINAAKQDVKKSKSGYWPTLSLSINAGTNYSSVAEPTYPAQEQLFDQNISGYTGLSLSIPIFDKLVTRYTVELSQLELQNQKLYAESIHQQMELDLQQAFEYYKSSMKQLDVAKDQKQYAQQSLAAYEERYKVNASTLAELSQARSQYLEATYEELKAKYNLLVRSIAVQYYTGNVQAMIAFLKP